MCIRDRTNYEVYCVGGGKAYSLIEFCNCVAKAFDKEHILPYIPGEYRFGDTRNACSDISKLKKLGWQPKRSIIDSVNAVSYTHLTLPTSDLV